MASRLGGKTSYHLFNRCPDVCSEQWGLVMPHENINLYQHWLRWWLFAWQHQTIAWTNADFRLIRFCGLNLREILQRNTELLFCTMNLKIMILILLPYFSGSNVLYHGPLRNMGQKFGGQCYSNLLAPGKFELDFRYLSFKWILVTDNWGISSETALIWNVTGLHWWSVNIGSGTGLVLSAITRAYVDPDLSPYGVTRPQWVKLLSNRVYIYHGVSFACFSYILGQPGAAESILKQLRRLSS